MYWHQYWLTIITDCIIWMRDVNRGNSCSMGRSKKGGVIWQISHCQWLGMDLISCYLPEKKKCLFNIQSCLDSGLFPMPFLHLVFFNLVKYVGWPRFPLTVLMILSPLFCLLPLLAVRGPWWERSVMEPEVRTCKEKGLFTITTPVLFTSYIQAYTLWYHLFQCSTQRQIGEPWEQSLNLNVKRK